MRAARERAGFECGNVLEAVDKELRENGVPELLVHLNVQFCACFPCIVRTSSFYWEFI